MSMAQPESGGRPEDAATPREAAGDLDGNLKREGRRLAADAKDAMRDIAAARKEAAADYMRAVCAAIDRGAEELEAKGRAGTASAMRQASSEIVDLARRVSDREPKELLGEVQGFARRHPAITFGLAALAGFAAMRFIKSSAESTAGGSSPAASSAEGSAATEGWRH